MAEYDRDQVRGIIEEGIEDWMTDTPPFYQGIEEDEFKEEKRDYFKIQAFFEEFTFLVEGDDPIIKNVEEVEDVIISRIGIDFLNMKPQYEGSTGSLVGIEDSERIFLLDCDGNLLAEVKQSGYCSHNEAHRENEEWSGETVGEALLRTTPSQVYYAVMVHTGYEVRDHYSVGGYSVTLYKPPGEFSLPDWVKERKRRAREKILDKIAKIDSEA